MNVFKKLRNEYVIWHANRVKLPQFTSSYLVRKKVIYSGRVQKVGFRLELFCIARRLGLTGFVKNLVDGSVEAELQGEESQIDFLNNCLRSLKRASVKKIDIIDMPRREGEDCFTIEDKSDLNMD